MRQLDACPICGSRAFRHVETGRTTRNPDDPQTWDLARCPDCDHGFLNPQPQWDELDRYYHEAYPPYEATHGLADELDATVEAARSRGEYRHVAIRPGLRLLDVGCGGGSFLYVARGLGAVAKGVEPSPFGARSARGLGLDVFEGTLEDYAATGPADRYDLITFSHVVEHLADPIGTLRVAGTLLAEGGMVWVAVPNGACAYARRLGWRWHSSDLPLHLQHFSPRSLTLAAERAGLKARRLYTYSLPLSTRESILLDWRYRWKVPRRIGGKLLGAAAVERQARRLDEQGAGEAIVAEFENP